MKQSACACCSQKALAVRLSYTYLAIIALAGCVRISHAFVRESLPKWRRGPFTVAAKPPVTTTTTPFDLQDPLPTTASTKKRKKTSEALKQTRKSSSSDPELEWLLAFNQKCLKDYQPRQEISKQSPTQPTLSSTPPQQQKNQKQYQLTLPVLKQMVPAMLSWARRKSTLGAVKAQELLERYVQEAVDHGNPHAVPNTVMFNVVMDAWAKTESHDAPTRITQLLEWMQTLRQEHNHTSWAQFLRPDVITFSTLVTAWAKSRHPEGATKAIAILDYMDYRGLQPNTITYNAVLHALALSKDKDRAGRAELLVLRMEEKKQRRLDGHGSRLVTTSSSAKPVAAPDVYTYQSLMAVWSRIRKAGAAQRVEQILRMLQEKAKEDISFEPNTHCYTAAIHAWARNEKEPLRARHAYRLLCELRRRHEHMQQQQQQQQQHDHLHKDHAKPNVVAYTAVINACVCSNTVGGHRMDHNTIMNAALEQEMALQIAQLTMEELRHYSSQYGSPNFLTYAALLRVYGSTLPPGSHRDALVGRAMVQCCQEGQLGQVVWDTFEGIASSDLMEKTKQALGLAPLASNDGVSVSSKQDGVDLHLARHWSRNVKGERLDAVKHASPSPRS